MTNENDIERRYSWQVKVSALNDISIQSTYNEKFDFFEYLKNHE